MQYIGEVYNVNCEEAQIRIEAYSVSNFQWSGIVKLVNRNQLAHI